MLLGIDVGGTHTDAVIINQQGIVATAKVITVHDNLLHSVQMALEEVLQSVSPRQIRKINLSTTLTTNAIIEQKLDPVGMFVASGPGIDPQQYQIGDHYFSCQGSIDHRGVEREPLADGQIESYLQACRADDVRHYAAVSKFSPRNPIHEKILQKKLPPHADFVTLGHQLSGRLNFPRRIATAYYNSAIRQPFNHFADAIEDSVKKLGVQAPINILKADGGTMPFSVSRRLPVESILSGPAASVMGIVALCDISEDAIILDIGGTTTDIAIFATGAPLLEKEGINIGGHSTLVRALITRSIGIGGDSLVQVSKDKLTVGPQRHGPAMAFGGTKPTLIDACNIKGLSTAGNKQASVDGMTLLAEKRQTTLPELADKIIDTAINSILSATSELIQEINNRPVYTVHEMLANRKLAPKKIYIMGGPAASIAGILAKAFKIPETVPHDYAIANAIGAALTRSTMEIELFADTEKKTLMIPVLEVVEKIPFQYSLDDAISKGKTSLAAYLQHYDHKDINENDIETVEADSFNMISNYFTVGKNIRVSCQLKPGIEQEYRKGLQTS
ncbi:MAG: hydantoinase/oxoprolinase family protein [Pseudomonadota bacterium]|nr:hydantoinase/oxoprolinase family protein [Pseudomonadota bacterium]